MRSHLLPGGLLGGAAGAVTREAHAAAEPAAAPAEDARQQRPGGAALARRGQAGASSRIVEKGADGGRRGSGRDREARRHWQWLRRAPLHLHCDLREGFGGLDTE